MFLSVFVSCGIGLANWRTGIARVEHAFVLSRASPGLGGY